MAGGVGMKLNFIGQKRIQRFGIDPNRNAEKRSNSHRHLHMGRCLFRAQSAVVSKKCEIRNFDARMGKYTRRGKHQYRPDDGIMLDRGGIQNQRFSDKSRKQWKGRNRRSAYQTEGRRARHGSVKAAKFRGF